MYTTAIILPFLGAVTAGLGGRYLGNYAGYLATGSFFLASILSVKAFFNLALDGSEITIKLFDWFTVGSLNLEWGLNFDTNSVIMMAVVSIITTLVLTYSIGYMEHDPHKERFLSFITLFGFFMLCLVVSNNYIQLFLFWEGIGLCSYLLIGFWFTNIQANKSAIQAMVFNRVGDMGYLLALFVIYYVFRTFDFKAIAVMSEALSGTLFCGVSAYNLIGILLLIGCAGKSAQLFLHPWLVFAMAGPTPVSSLLHSCTLVSAGVYLLIKSAPILELAPLALTLITILGAMTAFFAASIGLAQNDLKRIIAFSTCSQLGYMVFACGLSNYGNSLYHLANHAWFKCLLFLSAGSIIHAASEEQDIRKLGGMIKALPLTYSTVLIGSLSLMGFPFLTGFYSKDALLETAITKYTIDASFAHWLGTIAAFFTAYYSLRLIYLTFIQNPQSAVINYKTVHESPITMTTPLIILTLCSIFVGYLGKDFFMGLGSPLTTGSLIQAEHLSTTIKWIPVILSISGALIAIALYGLVKERLMNAPGRAIYTFLNNKWHLDYIYIRFLGIPAINWGHDIAYKLIDRGLIEAIGPKGLSSAAISATKLISRAQSGQLYHYTLLIVICTLIIV